MGLNNFTGKPTGGGNAPTGGNNGILGGMPSMPPAPPTQGNDPTDMLINYNEQFAQSGTILYRDEVIQQTLSVLIGKNKPNALLVGPAGVGKTKIVEDIAYRLQNDDPLIPNALKGYTIYELPLQNVVAGASLLGEFEENVKAIVDFISNPKEKAILFIDEIHQLTEESSTTTYKKIAQFLKPALARGNMKCIGATTTQEAKSLLSDPAFNRRFSQLTVDELTSEQTLEILINSKAGFFKHYNNKVTIDDDTLKTVVTFANEYKKAGNHRPDNALTLLDRSISDAIIDRKVKELQAQASGDQNLIQAFKAMPIIPLTERQIKKTAINLATGNSKPTDFEEDAINDALSRIKGQDEAITRLVRALKEHNSPFYKYTAANDEKNKPETFLFVGPSGVGKTEVTKIISKYITGTDPIVLNMTEYNSPASINRIIGAPPGYVGYSSNTELPFDILSTNPYQIILLDEFEKCDAAVKTLFMQAFDEGFITTSKGTIVDFSRAIIIATTNAGNQDFKKSLGFNAIDGTDASVADLSKFFDVALLNRFNHILTFNPISKKTYREIIQETYKRDVTRILTDYPRTTILPEIPDDDLDEIVESTYEKNFGARPAAKAVKKYVLNQVL